MDLPLSRLAAPRLVALDTVGSTNDELTRRAAGDPSSWPDGSVVVTLDQTAGRGRRGRVWVAPPGRALAVSVLCAPADAALDPGWLPLMAGLALVETLRGVVPAPAAVTLKWPNDVQLDGRKVSGILGELVSPGRYALGTGLNLTLEERELPTGTSTSLRLAGVAEPDADAILAAFLAAFGARRAAWERAGGDARAAGLVEELARTCATIGRDVRVELPGGGELLGRATGVDDHGRLTVESAGDPGGTSVAAGDVTHLRYQ
ncbi:biotin--[acetyl-CoA-carboxylase] ligase [Clavibacter tessellarius]|uniref:biotin--[biotin carboxyl-carrier protein] ligase n=1 Tax=Clavibacter tessellarius TaxID=31965 RepID=A0A225CD01_9MICO|nr:biotin--[acetyl-CoA-carboxylase] ligase [Clavibacter michiganensis]OQJ61645.1 biotin--[acetyl-CoA-carboxylase] ligase [Clavibacter michiganensis subsp. tessellarius]UKF32657.1 biotin--[acetyl-CoA-carboxylase] ligase [Clavibacter michiganensis subsp. tessellarius]